MAAHSSFIESPLPDVDGLVALIERLDEAAIDTARELARAKDRSFGRRAANLPLRAQALRMAFTMQRPANELIDQIRELMARFDTLETQSSKSRLRRDERVAITIGRALSYQLWKAFVVAGARASRLPEGSAAADDRDAAE